MSTQEHAGHTHHVPTTWELFRTFLLLSILMGLTIWSKWWDLGSPIWNNAINLGIAVAKASLVVTFFMGLKWASNLSRMFGLGGFIWLMLITITFGDYTTRQWEPAQGWYKQDKGQYTRTYQSSTQKYPGVDNVGQEPSMVPTVP